MHDMVGFWHFQWLSGFVKQGGGLPDEAKLERMPEITPLEINSPEKNPPNCNPLEMNPPFDMHTPEKPPPSVLAK